MKSTFCWLIAVASIALSNSAYAQPSSLEAIKSIDKKIAKGESHAYTVNLKKGEYVECMVMQKGVDVAIDVTTPSGKKLKTFDSPNGTEGAEQVSIEALETGKYQLHIYPLMDQTGMPDSVKANWAEENQGNYTISDVIKLSASAYKQKLARIQEDKNAFAAWLAANSHEIKTVDAGNGFDDLEPFRNVLKNVRVVGLGEASHGTSEFFRMKHRMLEFLVKEMGFTSFYIEASMARCRYINNYVLKGIGDLDTATAIQGFVTWRVQEVKNMIEWMRRYNISMPEENKIRFYGYDLQINDFGWNDLKSFYKTVKPGDVVHLDSLKIRFDTASKLSNDLNPQKQKEGASSFKRLYLQCLSIMNDIVLNQGQYQYITGKEVYEKNLMNIRLIVQETESYQNGFNDRRDHYMAQNILYLLNNEPPGAKVVVWAHNSHIGKQGFSGVNSMGNLLAATLKKQYYAIGFEFFSGSFQTRNMDIDNKSQNWDVMTVGAPPAESLPWYLDKAGKSKYFIDFRNTGSETIANFSKEYDVHGFGSMYSIKWPATYPSSLSSYDGMIYIKVSTAAKNLTKVYLR